MRRPISALLVIALIITMAATYITVGADDAADTLTLSTAKTAYALGEDIVVDITGITETLSSHDLELRLEKGIVQEWHGYADRSKYGYKAYLDIGLDARDEYGNLIPTPVSTHQVTFKDGIRVHPVSNLGNLTITAGYYTLWVLDFTAGKECANRIYITVGEGEENAKYDGNSKSIRSVYQCLFSLFTTNLTRLSTATWKE